MFKTALLATLGVLAGLTVVSVVGTVIGTGVAAAEDAYNNHKAKKELKATAKEPEPAKA